MGAYNYPNPQAVFYQQFQAVRRDEVVGVLLALFFGSFGAHHFYLRRTGLGVLYLLPRYLPELRSLGGIVVFPWAATGKGLILGTGVALVFGTPPTLHYLYFSAIEVATTIAIVWVAARTWKLDS